LSTKRICLVVGYDGTDFCGWAAQAGQRTVQGTLTEAVRQVSGEEVEIVGASRTDGGAHARGQVCHFDASVGIDPAKWPRILNRVLPADVAVAQSKLVPDSFHSRFSAQDRWYRYRIATAGRDPLKTRYVHDYGRPLDLEAMCQAARALVGEHDFLAFTEELDPAVENTCRVLYRVDVRELKAAQEIQIDVTGTAFLRGMMRRMAGALLEVGRGFRPAEHVALLLTEERDRLQWPVVLPAKGLTLMRVRYGRHPRDNRTASDLA
jgi:tRNA pseudouridine38-40 synthase